MSGGLSIPSTVLALLVASGISGNQNWWNSTGALFCWFSIAVFAWAWTGYSVWSKERNRFIELAGRPEVTLKAVMLDGQLERSAQFRLYNNSINNIAVNVSVHPVHHHFLDLRFCPVSEISAQEKEVVYTVTVNNASVSPGEIFMCVGEETSYLHTAVEFSNYGSTRTWIVDYILVVDPVGKEITCRQGACQLKTETT